MRNILFILAALIGFGAFGQTNIPTRQMLADTNGVVKWPTNITRIRIGGTDYTNLLGFGLSITNGQLSVDTTQLPAGSGGDGLITSVAEDFEVTGGELALTNALGTGPLVRQSAASGVGTVTSVGASTTVAGLGFNSETITNSGTLSLTGVVAVASGGTGGTTAAAAKANLGILSSRWITGFGSPTNFSQGVGTYYVNLATYQVWEQIDENTFQTMEFFVMGEGAYTPLDWDLVTLGTLNAQYLTNLNGSAIQLGTVAEARIDSAIARVANVQPAHPNLTNLASASITGSGAFMRTRTGVPREIWIPANAMTPTTETPTPATNTWATTTDGQRVEAWDFSASTTNALNWTMALPLAWDGSTVKAKVVWKQVAAEATSTNRWAVGGGSVSNGETAGNTMGSLVMLSAVGANDTNIVSITDATAAITIGGTPSSGHLTWFTIRRHPGDAGDNSTVLARLFGVHLQYTETPTEPTAW